VAISALAALNSPHAAELVLKALGESINRRCLHRENGDCPRSRDYDIEEILSFTHPDIAPLLIKTLEHPVPQMRASAASGLAHYRGDAVVAALGRVIGDPDPVVRARVVRALALFRSSEALPFLVRAAADIDRTVRTFAGHGLEALASPATADALSSLVADVDLVQSLVLSERLRWISALPLASGKDFVRRLASKSEPTPVRAWSAEVLGLMRCVPATTTLIEALDNPAVPVRAAAARALGEMLDPRAQLRLTQALRDPAPTVRATAAFALGRMGARAATPNLQALYKGAYEPPVPHGIQRIDPGVRNSAAWALARLRDRNNSIHSGPACASKKIPTPGADASPGANHPAGCLDLMLPGTGISARTAPCR
jgi:HEAT repeat protein